MRRYCVCGTAGKVRSERQRQCKDAAVSAKQYRTAAEKLISGLSAEKTVLAKIIMLDRYSK